MIDFACKTFDLDEIVKCALGLTKADFKILEYLLKNDDSPIATEDLAGKLSLNLSTVQRAVKKLHERNVLLRTQQNIDGGGYLYRYKIKNKPELRNLIMEIVKGWTKKVETSLNHW